MIRSLGELIPKINDKAYVSEFAYVVGEIEIDEFSSTSFRLELIFSYNLS